MLVDSTLIFIKLFYKCRSQYFKLKKARNTIYEVGGGCLFCFFVPNNTWENLLTVPFYIMRIIIIVKLNNSLITIKMIPGTTNKHINYTIYRTLITLSIWNIFPKYSYLSFILPYLVIIRNNLKNLNDPLKYHLKILPMSQICHETQKWNLQGRHSTDTE